MPDFSLLTNNFPRGIPRNDYLVCPGVTRNDETIGCLKPGGRVLVAWLGNDAVVLDGTALYLPSQWVREVMGMAETFFPVFEMPEPVFRG